MRMCRFSFYRNAMDRFDSHNAISINDAQRNIALAVATILGADKYGEIMLDKLEANQINVTLERDFDKHTAKYGFVMAIDM